MSTRKDLPNPNAPNFLQRVREEIHALLGKTGSARDRALTLADAINSGVIGVGPGGSLVPGPATGETYVPDLTPPPAPDTLTATPAISHILLEVPAATYTQGHGHLRTRVYGATRLSGDPAPVFADAVEVGQFGGTVWAFPSNPATTWHLWAKWESVDGVLSATPVGGTNGVVATTGQDVSHLVLAMTGPGNPFKVVTEEITLPDGSVVPVGTYTADAYIHNGQITNAKIANLAVDDAKIANLSVSKLVAGSLAVGQYAENTGYVAGSAGWRINGDGTAEFSGVVVRGTVYASAGLIGGNKITETAIESPTASGFDSGSGFHLGSDGRARFGNPTGARIQWTGTAVEIYNSSNELTITSGGVDWERVLDKPTFGSFSLLDMLTGDNVSTYIANGAIKSAQIGNAEIKTANIEDGAIKSAKIGTGEIKKANIGEAEIDTLRIQTDAVIVPRYVESSAAVALPSQAWAEILNMPTFNTLGAPVLLLFTVEASSKRVRILRNGTVLGVVDYPKDAEDRYVSGMITQMLYDPNPGNSANYTMQVYNFLSLSNYTSFRKMQAMATKR